MKAGRAARAFLWGALVTLYGCTTQPVEAPQPPPVDEKVEPEPPLRLARANIGPVDRVLVDKSERRLYLMRDGRALAWIPVGLGREPEGPKRKLGDNRTPEGKYVLDWRNPSSRFYRSIHISYPNESDLRDAFRRDLDPGGDIFIHGTPHPLLLGRDWTTGCIAVSNRDIDLIWRLVPDGTPITIRP